MSTSSHTPRANTRVAVLIDVLIVTLFGSVVLGLLYAGHRINKDEEARTLAEAPGEQSAAREERRVVRRPDDDPDGATAWAVYEIERHLRHEVALARAFSEDPSPQTLWLR